MKLVKINFGDEQYDTIKQIAEEQGMSIQDLIRAQFNINRCLWR